MRCPFLQETEVRSCQSAGIRKMIQRNAGDPSEKCSSGGYRDCPVYRERETGAPEEAPDRCPFLRTSLMHYCGAVSFTKFVPYSDSTATRCGNAGFHFCDIYLNLAHAGSEPGDRLVEGLRMPGTLSYTANHLWLDLAEEGRCHVGIDAFLANLLQRVDAVTFVTLKGVHHPTAILAIRGVELHLVFPNPMFIVQPNLYLRADPSRITTDPYCSGWLFEGQEISGRPVREGLLDGRAAETRMRRDIERLSFQAHRQAGKAEPAFACDGGTFGPDLLEHLTREEKLALFHEFFSPYAGVEKKEQ